MATSGSLRLSVIEAKLTRDTEWFSKMDPYCVIETRHQKVRTRTINEAGKTPKWNQVFDIDVKYIGDDMIVTVYDEDVTSDDLVGKTTIKMSSLCINGGLDDWFPIQFKGRQSGQVHLKGDWRPATAQVTGGPMAAMMGKQLGMQVQMGHAQHVMGMGLAQPMMAPQMMMGYQQPMMQPGMMPMQQPVMGMQQPVMGMQQPVMGMQQPMGMGMQQPVMGMGMQPMMQSQVQQPGMMQPGMMQPGMQQPMMQQPMMQQPGMMQPGMQQPGMMRPPQQQLPQGGYTYNQY